MRFALFLYNKNWEVISVKTSSTTTNKAPPKERYSKQARKGRLKL